MAPTNESFETLVSNMVTRDIVNLPVGFFTKAVGQFTVTNMVTMHISLVYPTDLTWADTESVLGNRYFVRIN
jgi:hypothetical protein